MHIEKEWLLQKTREVKMRNDKELVSSVMKERNYHWVASVKEEDREPSRVKHIDIDSWYLGFPKEIKEDLVSID